MQKYLLAISVILTVATGCDNVAWGGIDVQLRGPPETVRSAASTPDSVEVDSAVRVPGPILLAGERDGRRASLVLVGELLADGLNPFPNPAFPEDATRLDELSSPGSEWILFSEGVRVGRLSADATEPAEEYCGNRVRISGVVELVPDAADAQRLLAMPAEDAAGVAYGPFEQHQHVYEQRVASLSIAGEAIPRYGAAWPEGGVLDIRDHIQAFRLDDTAEPWIAATFVNADDLAISSPGQGAYGLFVIGRPAGDEYAEAFAWYRSVEAQGKGVPRYHDHLDWDDDGAGEILLDMFGASRRWFAALDRQNGEWVRSFEDACGSGSTNAN